MTNVRLPRARYRRWLDDNAVRFVALADAPIDYSAAREAQLVRDGLPYLREVWRDAHWRVFEVAGARPLARGAARATALEPERVRLAADRAGAVDLRVRFTPYWRIATGRGCVAKGPGGWTRLRDRPPRPRGPRDRVRPRPGARDVAALHGLSPARRSGARQSGSLVPVRCG